MSTFHLKSIALITMLLDHIGLFFFPQIIILRVIGRLSFPLFAWLIANGAIQTKNSKAYLFRLFFFACVAQMPYSFVTVQQTHMVGTFNVLFTLFLGLLAIVALNTIPAMELRLLAIVICAILAEVFHTDYGATGVVSVVVFYLFFNKKLLLALSQITLYTVPLVGSIFVAIFRQHILPSPDIIAYIEPIGLFSLIFIFSYNGQQGPKMKYVFYCMYPLQYVIIFLVKMFF